MIRRRLMLIAAPLCVVVLAASVAFAATPDTEHTGDAKLDKLHSERPDAASDLPVVSFDDPTNEAKLRNRFRIALQRAADADGLAFAISLKVAGDQGWTDAVVAAVEAFLASFPPPATSSAGSSSASWSGGGSSAGSSDALACIRAHESDSAGGYGAVSPGGTYRGAYQFLPSTWNNVAASSGRSDLVGVDPASASPADQDAMASSLYSAAGSQPWGGRC